jgi:hypothetical protein
MFLLARFAQRAGGGSPSVTHTRSLVLAWACVVACPPGALAQAPHQLWADATIKWLTTDRLTSELEVEPKTNPATLGVTPQLQYAIVPWADAIAEVQLAHTSGADPSATPRFGAEFHILSRLLHAHADRGRDREKAPRRRLAVSSLLRFEHSKSAWDFRDRFNAAYPLNRPKTTSSGAVSLIGDVEVFIPFDHPPGGGRVDHVRARSGVGYRHSFAWSFEALYIWDGTRRAESQRLTPTFHAIDIRITRQF